MRGSKEKKLRLLLLFAKMASVPARAIIASHDLPLPALPRRVPLPAPRAHHCHGRPAFATLTLALAQPEPLPPTVTLGPDPHPNALPTYLRLRARGWYQPSLDAQRAFHRPTSNHRPSQNNTDQQRSPQTSIDHNRPASITTDQQSVKITCCSPVAIHVGTRCSVMIYTDRYWPADARCTSGKC